jgi:hypothetical protein
MHEIQFSERAPYLSDNSQGKKGKIILVNQKVSGDFGIDCCKQKKVASSTAPESQPEKGQEMTNRKYGTN